MTIYAKPAVRHAWAETPPNGSGDIQDPGDSFVNAGWQIGVKPPRQYFNWVLNYNFNAVRYFSQRGIADWDPLETYQQNALINSGGGIFRSSINNNIGNNPPTTIGTAWQNPAVQDPLPGDLFGVTNQHWVNAHFIPVGSTFNAISGTIANAQVPLSAVQQWQGSLSITFGQLVGQASSAQVPLAAVQQWQASLLIGWGQLTGTKNADQLQGLTAGPLDGFTANTLARCGSAGYLYAAYFNQASANNEDPAISQFMVTNGADNFLRKASVATVVATVLGPQSLGNPNGYFTVGGLIVNYGYATSATASVVATFTKPFPHAFLGGHCTTNRSAPGSQGYNHLASGNNNGAIFIMDQLDASSTHGGWWIAYGF